jgi:hypothetical protein
MVETLRLRIMKIVELPASDPAATVLAKSLMRCARILGIDTGALSEILGVDPNLIRGMESGVMGLEPSSGPGKQATTLIRCHLALHSLVGGNAKMMVAWLNSFNTEIKARPIDLILHDHGLHEVNEYLEKLVQT